MKNTFDVASFVETSLVDLALAMRTATRGALLDAVLRGVVRDLGRPHSVGAGDVTYAIDVPAERALDIWLDEMARKGPLSLCTEDSGWRHRGPSATGGVATLAGFDHGGPRVVVDPIDGTRNLMADLRSAWSVIAVCAPGRGEPRMSDVSGAVLSEIPDSRGAQARVLVATASGARLARESVPDGTTLARATCVTDEDDRADHGYFPFFRYMAEMRPALARIEADFFARLESHERADVRTCYDDQYISNGGQLALLTLGTYRMIADLRAFVAERRGAPTLTSKPYDVAGAIFVARAAGAIVTAPGGGELDFQLDVHTPISFVGWANARTRARLEPHLNAVLAGA